MICLPRCVFEAGEDVIGLQELIVRQDFIVRRACAQQPEHIGDPEPESPDARASAALAGLDRDAREESRVHARNLNTTVRFASATFTY